MGQQTQDRRWEINLEYDEFGQAPLDRQFEADVQQAMAESAAILLRLGGAIQSYVIRQQDPETGLWFPMRAVFKWQSFVPGIRAPRVQPVAPGPVVDVLTPEHVDRLAEEYADVLERLADGPPPEGEPMVGPGGEQELVPFGEVQDRLRAGWRPAGDIEDEGAGT